MPKAGRDFQAGRPQTRAPLARAHFTAEDPWLRAEGQMARGSVSQMPAQKPNFQRVPPHPVLGNQRGWVGPTRPVPTFLPQPHLRQEEERAGQGRGLSKVGLILRQSRFYRSIACLEEVLPRGRVVVAGPLHKRPTVSLAGRLFLRDFRKKRGTGDSHSAPQEPEVVHKGALLLAEARPAPHAA